MDRSGAFGARQQRACKTRHESSESHEQKELPRQRKANSGRPGFFTGNAFEAQDNAAERHGGKQRCCDDGVGFLHGADDERDDGRSDAGQRAVDDGLHTAHLAVGFGPEAEQYGAANSGRERYGGDDRLGRLSGYEPEPDCRRSDGGERYGERAESKPFAERPDPRSDERKDEKRCDIAESHPRVEGIAEYGLVNASGKDADNVGAAQPCDENAHAEIAGG